MLQDVIDLRNNGWEARRKVEGPKKIQDVHREARMEVAMQADRGRMARPPSDQGRGMQRGGGGFDSYGPRGAPPPPPQRPPLRMEERVDGPIRAMDASVSQDMLSGGPALRPGGAAPSFNRSGSDVSLRPQAGFRGPARPEPRGFGGNFKRPEMARQPLAQPPPPAASPQTVSPKRSQPAENGTEKQSVDALRLMLQDMIDLRNNGRELKDDAQAPENKGPNLPNQSGPNLPVSPRTTSAPPNTQGG
uniref:Uncharacterized protein n=1 Tax=Tetraselmis sp. GSL018 TaxID=582737 RepID=A0A061QJK4_9CHLO